ncbi:MAG TPA: helix-hairpin-helix domain-containing protein [Bryobacteraceae bacterium]|nr:helix-hairpin-helix domain-containing protein [Bryobacteraceae bacterium]
MRLIAAALLCAGLASADIPSGPGKEETIKYCATCHSVEQAVSARQGEEEWAGTLEKMAGMGAKIPDESYDVILTYLAKHFGPDAPLPIRVNTASAVDLESLLLLKRSESAAIIKYRTDHGNFKTIDDLRKVPGLDFKKIEAKKDLLVF